MAASDPCLSVWSVKMILQFKSWTVDFNPHKGQGSRVKGQGSRSNLVFGIFFLTKKLSLTSNIFYLTNFLSGTQSIKNSLTVGAKSHLKNRLWSHFIIFFKKADKLFKDWNLLWYRLLTTKNWWETVKKKKAQCKNNRVMHIIIASFVPYVFRMMQNSFKKNLWLLMDNLKVHHL